MVRKIEKDGVVADKNLVVCGKYEVPCDFVDLIYESYIAIRPALMAATNYTTADICGDELWETLSSEQRRHAYLCLKYTAVGDKLELVSDGEGGPLYFRLI